MTGLGGPVVGKTILLLDENEASLKFLANTLREKQFKVLEAASGKEALIAAWRDEPDLVLFDPILSDFRGEEFIQKLRQNVRTNQIPIIALSSDPNPARREGCLNAGATEYILKSSEAISALGGTLDRIFGAQTSIATSDTKKEENKEKGLLIVFLSAKGGTGTSSLCANLAMNIKLHEPDARVVVADLVLPIGSIGQIVGYEGKLNLVTVADLPSEQTNEEYFRENLPELELWKFRLLAGSPNPQDGYNIKINRIEQVVDVLRTEYDFIFLDLGRSLSRISLPLIQKADLIPLIVATDQSTVQLTKTVLEYFQTQDVDEQSIYAILNRAVGLEGLTKAEAEALLGFTIKTTLPYMGSTFTLANNLNQPITIKFPNDTASIIFKETAGDMIKVARRHRAR